MRAHKIINRAAAVVLAAALTMAAAATGRASGALEAAGGAAPPDGAQLFRTYCASCHGLDAAGAGPAAVAMRVTPPDLTRIAARNHGTFPAERVRQIILGKGPAAHGERNMPVWGDVFARKLSGPSPDALVDALVRHLDSVQQRSGE
jgi:mono/diheme cytochrome c family protein